MNTIDKYPAEWFHTQAQSEKYILFDTKMKRVREEFLASYGLEQLKSWRGKDLLFNMFLNDGTKKENLCYMLEMNKDIKNFGGIGGGSSYKYGLFFYKKTARWTTGSPLKPVDLSESEAIELATKIRDNLVEGAEIIKGFGSLNSREDYEKLYDRLAHIPNINSVWVMKYYQMLFPDYFAVFYGKNIQENTLRFLKEQPSDIPFVRMGQIQLFVKECGIPSWVFGELYYSISQNDTTIAAEDILSEKDEKEIRYWTYSAGTDASHWEDFYSQGIMALAWGELGNLNDYNSKEEMRLKMKEIYGDNSSYTNSALATWQFVHEMQPGDVILAKKGQSQLLGRGVVEGDYEFIANQPEGFNHCRKVKWTHKGIWTLEDRVAQKTLTDVSVYTDFIAKVNSLFQTTEEGEEDKPEVKHDPYSAEMFLDDVFMDSADYQNLVALLCKKKNVILQGAPGVGKTFAAKRLAYSIIGEIDKSRVMMVQFHQSYSYEDFIMGYRPVNNGFELKKGVFYNFCKAAEKDKENKYFFIIDEINRGNLSKIFGELFMLIEADKRGNSLQLLYSDELFAVPENVYIIGMMNTADRSLAMLDYALRRRFAFVEMKPGFETDGFQRYQESLENSKFDRLIDRVKYLNEKIAGDDSLGDGFCIGHSYFCNLKPEEITDQDLHSIVEYELIPLLKEYWFDEPSKVKEYSNDLRSAIK